MAEPVEAPQLQEDPYEVLGVDRSATEAEMKAAHKKLVLKYHPDKNAGNPEAEEQFQKVQAAWGILSDPELKAKYDAGGLDAIDEAALAENIQVDVSQMGFMGSTVMSMFRRMGHPVKTVVSQSVLEQVAQENLHAVALQWSAPVKGRVGNGQAVFYTLDINSEALEAGFVVSATCNHARVKLLLWDKGDDGAWSLAAQEDTTKLGDVNASMLLHTNGDTLEGVPKSVEAHLQAAQVTEKLADKSGKAPVDPLNVIFRTLDGAHTRDRLSLRAGTHLLAVYGDNFFKKSQYTLCASVLGAAKAAQKEALEATERKIMDKRGELLGFEKEFKRVRAEFEAAMTTLEGHTKDMDDLFAQQQAAYCALLGMPVPNVPGAAAGGAANDATQDERSAGSGAQAAGGVAESGSTSQQGVFKSAGKMLDNTFKGLFGKKKQAA